MKTEDSLPETPAIDFIDELDGESVDFIGSTERVRRLADMDCYDLFGDSFHFNDRAHSNRLVQRCSRLRQSIQEDFYSTLLSL